MTDIMDLVVRSALANRDEIRQLRNRTQEEYNEIMDPSRLEELQGLAESMSGTLQTYAPGSRVELTWTRGQSVDIPLPRAEAKLTEDGYPSTVGRTGHGLQRAFIITMFQHLAVAHSPSGERQASEEGTVESDTEKPQVIEPTRMPNLIIGIEEPELYQHPGRQRHLSKTLFGLARGSVKGVADRTQVVYSTHSPLFVGLDHFDRIRLLRKVEAGTGRPKTTRVFHTTLDEVAEEIWQADGKPKPKYTGSEMHARLQALMTPSMNEGFFADVVVLVEGEKDRAAILGMALAKGCDLESSGYAIIECGGKHNLDRPLVIFHRLGIPVYVIWDCDKGGKDGNPAEHNRFLRLLGQAEEEWPATKVAENFACFETTLDATLRDEIGNDVFDRLIVDWQDEFGVTTRDGALMNHECIRAVIERAHAESKTSSTLEEIVDKILALNPKPAPI